MQGTLIITQETNMKHIIAKQLGISNVLNDLRINLITEILEWDLNNRFQVNRVA